MDNIEGTIKILSISELKDEIEVLKKVVRILSQRISKLEKEDDMEVVYYGSPDIGYAPSVRMKKDD